MKQRLQGVVVGVLVSVLLFGTLSVWASTTNRQIEVTFGNFRTTVWGREFTPRNTAGDILQPFYFDGSVYVPVEAVLYAMRANAQWNAQTGTLNFGTPYQAITPQPTPTPPGTPTGQGEPLRTAAPFFDRYPNAAGGPWNNGISFYDSLTMGGTTFEDALSFRRVHGGTVTQFSLHNLNRQYTTFSGYIGRVDGSSMRNVTINFIGDGRQIQTFNLRATDMPTAFSISVANVQQLRIEVVFPGDTRYAISGFLQ